MKISRRGMVISFHIYILLTCFPLMMSASCPIPEMIEPLVCSKDLWDKVTIFSKGPDTVDLKKIFAKMSLHLDERDKSFHKFSLHNDAFEVLENNTFGDITFEIMDITGKSFRRIESNAFSPNNTKTIKQLIYRGSDQRIYKQGEIDPLLGFKNNYFDALISLNSINFIKMYTNSSTSNNEVVLEAGQDVVTDNVKHEGLHTIEISGGDQYGFNRLDEHSFYHLDKLNNFTMRDTGKQFDITEHAFDFEKPSNDTLNINLMGNGLDYNNIKGGAFTNAKRPLIIDLSGNSFSYLDEKILAPILHIDHRNVIQFDNTFNCDCRMRWIKADKSLKSFRRIRGIKCTNGNDFSTLSEKYFDICTKL